MGWRNPDYGFDPMGAASGLGGLFGGLFGDSGAPYDKAMEQYREWADKAQNAQNPYLNAGKRGLQGYEDWANTMKDPTQFINNIMGDYQQSPYAQYLQKQAMNAGTNAASASGLTGSTPFMQQMQQNATDISSQDMNQWLQNVLGINTQYGGAQGNLMTGGQNAANALTNLYENMGNKMGEAAYGKEAGKQQNFWNKLGGAAQLGLSFL